MNLLKACLNGNRTPDQHERVPVTARELAEDAYACVACGAGAVHVHARRSDGGESLAAADTGAAVAAIRAACPGLAVGLTTGMWIEPDLQRRLATIAAWETTPDFATVNIAEPGAVGVAQLLLARRIGVEAGLATIADVHALADSGLADRCLRVIVSVKEKQPEQAVAAGSAIDDELVRLGIDAPQLHHGLGIATWSVIESAVARGHGIRIGLEDTLHLPDGTLARDNAQLVAAAARLEP